MRLTKKEIIGLLNNYSIRDFISHKKMLAGVANHNWIIQTKRGKFILRGVSAWKKPKDIMFEFEYMNYFRQKFSYQIPKPLENNNHNFITKYKNRLFWLYPLIDGNTIKVFSKNELHEIAKLMAEYHQILIKSNLDNGQKVTKPCNSNVLKELIKHRKIASLKKQKNDMIYLSEVDDLIKIYKQIYSKEYFDLKAYPLHRDINPENVIFKNGKAVGLIDFDNVSFYKEPLIKDIVILLMYSCRNKRDRKKLNLESARFFLKEYQKYRKLSINEIGLIPNLATSNAIEDFSYVQWLFNNDKRRAKLYRLKLYANIAKWFWNNKELIVKALFQTTCH